MALQVEAQNVRSRRAIELQLHLGLGLEDGDVAEIARQPRATAAPCPRRLGAGQLPLLYSLAGTRRESVLHFSPIGWVAHQISPGATHRLCAMPSWASTPARQEASQIPRRVIAPPSVCSGCRVSPRKITAVSTPTTGMRLMYTPTALASSS